MAVGVMFWSSFAYAQTEPADAAWIQIEASSSREVTLRRLEALDGALENLAGFAIGGGWFGIAVGPFPDRDTAQEKLRELRREGRAPSDSFITGSTSLREQIWPEGVDLLSQLQQSAQATAPSTQTETQTPEATQPDTSGAAAQVVNEVVAQAVEEQSSLEVIEETLAQARASERLLTSDQKKELQEALQWAGVYNSTIDGLYGQGTRTAMSKWQGARDLKRTGVLTTMQRATLLKDFYAILEGLDFQTITDETAGIEVLAPMGVLQPFVYDAPFLRFEGKEPDGPKLILISQMGDDARMAALYNVLQTLEIMPQDGPRSLGKRSFSLEGQNTKIHSSAFARLQSGQIKGAILVWPTGDEERRKRVEQRVFRSFKRLTGVLGDASFDLGAATEQLSGLPVRQPVFKRSGVFVNDGGLIATVQDDLATCGYVEIEDLGRAKIVSQNDYIAILQTDQPAAPLSPPLFQSSDLRMPSEVAVGGYSFGGLLGAPTLTFGKIEAQETLEGATDRMRLSIDVLAGDVGGPVFDRGGAIIGMLLPPPAKGARQLPAGVNYAANVAQITDAIGEASTVTTTDTIAYMHAEDISRLAQDIAVVVTCWE